MLVESVKKDIEQRVVGRFAPSPTGRMHMGNLFSALISWLSVRSRGGSWILRIEDLDPQRSRLEYARQVEDDLLWLGLDWDEGGLDNRGSHGPYSQSSRSEYYQAALASLNEAGLLYPCSCRRADILATQAPHQSDGRIVYAGTCRPENFDRHKQHVDISQAVALRLFVPDEEILFYDRVFGSQSVNLSGHCGDFIVRRADGAWAYQLAVVVDDIMMGVTEVVRGCDLLLSSAQQIYLYRLFAAEAPEFAHLPLICNAEGLRLSKRDASMSMDALRQKFTARQLTAYLAHIAGILPVSVKECSPQELISCFNWDSIDATEAIRI